MKHPRAHLDEQLTHPVRFSITALLAHVEIADFAFIRDEVEVSDSVLSRQLSALEQAEIVEVLKDFVGKKPRTRARLTRQGRLTFDAHVRALQDIVAAPTGRTSDMS